jgi:hypothetical protein
LYEGVRLARTADFNPRGASAALGKAEALARAKDRRPSGFHPVTMSRRIIPDKLMRAAATCRARP